MKKVEIFTESTPFVILISICILANTVVLAMDKYPMEDDYKRGLEISNLVFTILFTFEMILKLIGLGPVGYVRDTFNIFDGTIVILSLVELIFDYGDVGVSTGGGVQAI